MWKCTKCGETSEEQYDSCWKCQAPRSGAPTLPEELSAGPPDAVDEKGPKPQRISRGRALLEDVFSHWGALFQDFHTSSMEFYASIEEVLERRKVPDISVSRVTIDETSPLSAKRVYLRVRRGGLTFDICAAPYGTGFFFSWWLSSRASRWWLNAIFLALPFILIIWATERHRIPVGLLGVLTVGIAIPIFRWLARRETYYKLDSMLMFQEAVRMAVNEVINGLRTAKGLRVLNAQEQKPIMRGFLGHK